MAVHPGDEERPSFRTQLQKDLTVYLGAMERQLLTLDSFYDAHGLESDEVV